MPATTPGRNLPYPLGTDRLSDGDDQIRKLAQSVENMIQTSTINVPIVAANTPVNVVWVFPVPFAAAPVVLCTVQGNAITGTALASSAGPTTTQVTITGWRATGTTAIAVLVAAIGPVTPVA